METEAPDGYCASNGQCSPRKEKSRMLADLSTSTPNGKATPQGPKSPRGLTIKQEQEDEKVEEDHRRSPAQEEMDQNQEEETGLEEPMTDSPNNLQDGPDGAANRLHNGDRPFQCSQCGVAFTQKGNLLRHIKLHTGEKPFKCPFCNYACRRRDALTGHLRTHAVGKPHKCNYCGRSYKQRTSLEEHKERCHGFLPSVGMDPVAGPYSGDVSKEPRTDAVEPGAAGAFDRPPVIERLHSTVGKRKSTNPQKFVGEKAQHYSYPKLGYEIGLKYDKEAHMMDQAINNAMSYLGSDILRPLVPHPGQVVPMVNPLFHHVLPLSHRLERPGSHEAFHGPPSQQQPPALPPVFPGHPVSNGPASLLPRHSKQQQHLQQQALGREESPSNSGLDSADSARSSPQQLSFHCSNPLPRPSSRASPVAVYSGERRAAAAATEAETMDAPHRGAAERPASGDIIRVLGHEGHEMRTFQCEHCRVLFLDHVMYTIHMGCHGYREPLECNICGHRSKDRYEFSSHIVRGEHTLQ